MIYLDNNATTPLDPLVLEEMMPFLGPQFANPGSGSTFGRAAKKAVEKARTQVATLIGCEAEEIIFTSGGTEADNAAIFSATELSPERKHIVTSAVEHDAVLAYLKWLEETRGYEITKLGVNPQGRLDLAELEAAIDPDKTALVTLMWANNETGVIFPIAEASNIAAEEEVFFHTDAVQAAGKISLSVSDTSIHSLALSGHKIHGPKGIGAMFASKNVGFRPWFHGGGQENQRRSGTENVAGIVGLGKAAELALSAHENVRKLRDHFERELASKIDGVQFQGSEMERLPNTSNVRIPGANSEGLMILLDMKVICVSAGSACHTGALHPSPVLAAMGLDAEAARECLRISFSRLNSTEEVETLISAMIAATERMRSI